MLEDVTVIHCIAVIVKETGQRLFFGPDQISAGLELLKTADWLIGHNILDYDVPAIVKLHSWWRPKKGCQFRDTQALARYLFSDMKEQDHRRYESETSEMEDDDKAAHEHLRGLHSLEAWGKRLGVHKTSYEGGFERYTEEMGAYCQQDTEVCEALDVYLSKVNYSFESFNDEQRFIRYTSKGTHLGFPIDVAGAERLGAKVSAEAEQLVQEIAEIIPPTVLEMGTPEWWRLWHNGVMVAEKPTKGDLESWRKAQKLQPKHCRIERGPNRTKTVLFNPNSRKQVREHFLAKYNYISPVLTDTGEKLYKEKMGTYQEIARGYGSFPEDLLRNLPQPEAKKIADYCLLIKRRGQILTGPSAWLKLQRNGRIHHTLWHIGAVTHRVAHSGPNMGQVPSVELDKDKHPLLGMAGRYGWECRSLFHAPPGYKEVGVDLSGIEARMLGHFLFPYDKGAYIDVVLNGDIHQLSVDSFHRLAGYTVTRKDAKTPLYAWLYSAGKEKMGQSLSEVCEEANREFLFWRDWLQGASRFDSGITKLASLIAWGTETPGRYEDPEYEEYTKTRRWVARVSADDVQTTTKLARKAVGGKVDRTFRKGITGLDRLIEDISRKSEQGFIIGLDGRRLPVRKEHAALNTCLQGNAAIVAKKWTNLAYDEITRRAIDAWIAAWVHDEIQSLAEDKRAEEVGQIVLGAIPIAGRRYNLHIRLDGEVKIGNNWAECH